MVIHSVVDYCTGLRWQCSQYLITITFCFCSDYSVRTFWCVYNYTVTTILVFSYCMIVVRIPFLVRIDVV